MSEAVNINGAKVLFDRRGVLIWPDEDLAVVSDLHLEKGASLARRGALLPPYDTAATLAALAGVLEDYHPRRVISLGDSFHDATASDRLAPADADQLTEMVGRHDWIWILGNHDPLPPTGLGGTCESEVELGPLRFVHEPGSAPQPGEVAGHLHPAASIRARGRRVRRRAFITDGDRLVMPSFGAYTGGLCALDPAITILFPTEFHAWMLGQDKVHAMRHTRLIPDRAPVTFDWRAR
jgi:DNA ligase-associated metallophosphoesterase